MAIFNKDMVALATANDFFQKEVYRGANVQLVPMSIPVGEDIGMESHRADQTTFFVAGEGQAIVDGHSTKVSPMIVIPKGAEDNIVNKGGEPLKLFSVYAPPAEEPGIAHRIKAEAEARAVKKVKEAVGG